MDADRGVFFSEPKPLHAGWVERSDTHRETASPHQCLIRQERSRFHALLQTLSFGKPLEYWGMPIFC
jgi:hypothetical protein